MMNEKRSSEARGPAPVNLNDHRDSRVQRRADDDHTREMMRALVKAIENSKKHLPSQPDSALWERLDDTANR
jgi:hypothetical protein